MACSMLPLVSLRSCPRETEVAARARTAVTSFRLMKILLTNRASQATPHSQRKPLETDQAPGGHYASTPVAPPNGWRVSGERSVDGKERVGCLRILGGP